MKSFAIDQGILEIIYKCLIRIYPMLMYDSFMLPPKIFFYLFQKRNLALFMKENPLSVGKYTVQGKLGYGGQSKVYLVSESEHVYAAKVYEPGTSKVDLFNNQILILSKIKSSLMINMIQALPSVEIIWPNHEIETRNVIILEYAQHGQLLQFVQKEGPLQENTCKLIFRELLKAIQILHNQGIFHRDIKLDNILIGKDFKIKLADFGLSRLVEDVNSEKEMTDFVGTQGCRSPEMECGNSYNGDKLDIFAAGVVLFMMFSGCMPFKSSKNSDKLYKYVKEKNYGHFWKVHQRKKSDQECKAEQFYPEEFRKLMNSFFSYDPQNRPTLKDLQENTWLKCAEQLSVQVEISSKILKIKNENPEQTDAQSAKEENPKEAVPSL